ncbi:MAG: RNA binding S1 domain protein [Candidatus Moranbacteria bacterium GW2011_GWF2_34_56]|nr:MAG: RNA binding S1 domain protein [Candidatus Moranbacteria bacterium GW2011_GWF1_34_10]KKP64128.1 MAG: RNA binding S1 domain protein [Candidatus Moranbacteria bacterium GW2011_GWF2_34_56]HBI17711.1 30S ribosomal protein S1 [Candidatus Moranbacteria bacterium]
MSNNILDNLVDNVKKEAPEQAPVKKNVFPEDDSVMGRLLQNSNIDFPEIGDVLDGVVIDISPHSVLLDLGSFGTGIVYGKDTKDGLRGNIKLKIGDQVHATLTSLENEEGYIELSIREASYEKAWEDLESKKDNEEAVNTKVLDANKGGLMVEINGIGGFLPVSQLASEHYPRVEDGNKNKILEKLKRLVGQTLLVKIIDTYRDEEKLIVSEKAAMSEKEQVMISRLKEGDTIEGEVSGVVDFGAFVKFLPTGVKEGDDSIEGDKLEGLVHISELAWQLIDNPREIIKVGDRIKAKIIGIDESRISLSIRALARDPWKEAEKKYEAGKTYTGKVDKINHFGAFVYLDANIHGLAHVSEFSEMYPGKKMEEMMEAGKEYSWKVLSIEPKDHRMGLVLVNDFAQVEIKEDSSSTKATADKKKSAKKEKVEKKTAKKETVKKESSSAKAMADEEKVSKK